MQACTVYRICLSFGIWGIKHPERSNHCHSQENGTLSVETDASLSVRDVLQLLLLHVEHGGNDEQATMGGGGRDAETGIE